jgi:hypothetical protein
VAYEDLVQQQLFGELVTFAQKSGDRARKFCLKIKLSSQSIKNRLLKFSFASGAKFQTEIL